MISICIPTYSQNGKGAKYFRRLLNSIDMQKCSYKYDIVVSDNSLDGEIEYVCSEFKQLPIRYFKNIAYVGVSNNINNAIEKASYECIKPMFQDDVFVTRTSLTRFIEALKKHKWVVSSSHYIDKDDTYISTVRPSIGSKFSDILNANTIGMPSVIAFRACGIKFNPKLKELLDTYFYFELFNKMGNPFIINKALIGQRIHSDSISAIQGDQKKEDWKVLKELNVKL